MWRWSLSVLMWWFCYESDIGMDYSSHFCGAMFSGVVLDLVPFFKGIYLSKALTCMKIFLNKQELLFVKETDTFSHIVV